MRATGNIASEMRERPTVRSSGDDEVVALVTGMFDALEVGMMYWSWFVVVVVVPLFAPVAGGGGAELSRMREVSDEEVWTVCAGAHDTASTSSVAIPTIPIRQFSLSQPRGIEYLPGLAVTMLAMRRPSHSSRQQSCELEFRTRTVRRRESADPYRSHIPSPTPSSGGLFFLSLASSSSSTTSPKSSTAAKPRGI